MAGCFYCEVWDSAGGESLDFCVQNIKGMCFGTDSVLCCWERREEVRERWWGGNYHIKGKEFKINLISQSPPTPKRFTVSMLRLVMRHKESTERVKWRWEERGRGSVRGNRLAPNQIELAWQGSHGRGQLYMLELGTYLFLVPCLCEVALMAFTAKATFAFTLPCQYISHSASFCSWIVSSRRRSMYSP